MEVQTGIPKLLTFWNDKVRKEWSCRDRRWGVQVNGGKRRGCKVRYMGGKSSEKEVKDDSGKKGARHSLLSRNLCRTHKNEWEEMMER